MFDDYIDLQEKHNSALRDLENSKFNSPYINEPNYLDDDDVEKKYFFNIIPFDEEDKTFYLKINKIKSFDFNFFFLKNFINFNFSFLLFYRQVFYNYALKNNETRNLNLFFFFNNTYSFENHLIFLKKKNFFFFNDLNYDIFSLIKDYKFKNSYFFDSKKRATKLFLDNFEKNLKNKLNFYNYFFKKKNILKKKNSVKKVKSKFVNCKKFFKSKKLEILKYLKNNFFKKKMTKQYISIFLKKLKKKSTLAISYSLSTNFFNVLSVFFFFLNLNYIKFLLKKKFFLINFKSVNLKKNSFNFGSFFSCIFFSQIFDFFYFFKSKITKYLGILSRKIRNSNSINLKLLNRVKSKNINVMYYLNNFNYINSKLIEADYLTLSFFFFGNETIKLIKNFGFNIFLYKLLMFK